MSDDSKDELEPLDGELAALFATERERPDADDARQERVLAAVLLTTGIGGGGGGGGESSPGPPAGAPSAPIATGVAAGSLQSVVVGALMLTLGLGAGAALHARFGEPRVEVRTVVERVRAEPAAVAPASEEEATAPVEGREDAVVAPSPPPATRRARREEPRESELASDALSREAEPAPDSDALSRESALLARAQAALARRSPALAIAALREHELRFQEGQLAEERDAIWISAVAASGDAESARRRAERFRARYPASPLLPSIEAALDRQ